MGNSSSDTDESNDSYVVALEIEHNQRIPDSVEQNFNIPYHHFKPHSFFRHKI